MEFSETSWAAIAEVLRIFPHLCFATRKAVAGKFLPAVAIM